LSSFLCTLNSKQHHKAVRFKNFNYLDSLSSTQKKHITKSHPLSTFQFTSKLTLIVCHRMQKLRVQLVMDLRYTGTRPIYLTLPTIVLQVGHEFYFNYIHLTCRLCSNFCCEHSSHEQFRPIECGNICWKVEFGTLWRKFALDQSLSATHCRYFTSRRKSYTVCICKKFVRNCTT
jgi:hypothetical protein